MTELTTFPAEIIHVILEQMSVQQRYSIARVCKLWAFLTKSFKSWPRIVLQTNYILTIIDHKSEIPIVKIPIGNCAEYVFLANNKKKIITFNKTFDMSEHYSRPLYKVYIRDEYSSRMLTQFYDKFIKCNFSGDDKKVAICHKQSKLFTEISSNYINKFIDLTSTIQIYDLESFQLIREFVWELTTICFGIDYNIIAYVTTKNEIRIVNAENGKIIHQLNDINPEHNKWPINLCFSKTCQYIAAWTNNGYVTIFDAFSGRTLRNYRIGACFSYANMYFSPDFTTILFVGDFISLWSGIDGSFIKYVIDLRCNGEYIILDDVIIYRWAKPLNQSCHRYCDCYGNRYCTSYYNRRTGKLSIGFPDYISKIIYKNSIMTQKNDVIHFIDLIDIEEFQ